MSALLTLTLLLAPAVEIQPIEGRQHIEIILERLGQGRVRFTHLGDSHIAADLYSGAVRQALRARYGDAGRGFVHAGRCWRSDVQAETRADTSGAWRADGMREGLDDGYSPLAGCSVTAIGWGGRAEIQGQLATAEVFYLQQPRGGAFDLSLDGAWRQRVSTRGPWLAVKRVALEPVAPGRHKVTMEVRDGEEVRLLGVNMTQPGPGIIYDALGVNGARASRQLWDRPAAAAALLEALGTDILILSYGANELYDDHLEIPAYTEGLDALLKRLRPSVKGCLLTGPPDMLKRGQPIPLTEAVIETQRALADAHGCAFWDARAAMGGPGSVRRWRRLKLAQRDFVHLTRDGYKQLAALLLAALMGEAEAP
ncbi:hypothetical protein KKF91_14485 [Myxococcota bacterium]|nr:hypothetical protein [Myxococcota bacterium]MBU1431749.1 hypothetical protein [Myxococcota bacterium]MBU1898568.1 hypothetical protein [Myxococcota bacterium]